MEIRAEGVEEVGAEVEEVLRIETGSLKYEKSCVKISKTINSFLKKT